MDTSTKSTHEPAESSPSEALAAAAVKPPRFTERLKSFSLKNWCYVNRHYLIAFFIPALIIYVAYLCFEAYPVGDRCVLVLDLNGQYVYYFEYLKKAIFGSSSVTYSWGRNLSGEFMGIIGYYLASPFTLIVMLLPRKMILGSIMIMQLAKIGASSVTFTYLMRKGRNSKPVPAVICGISYATCAYAVYQLMDPMWLDGLVFVPLIVLGIERMIDTGKKTGYIIPLAIMFIANFYIGYMVAIFVFFYYICYYAFCKKRNGWNWKSELTDWFNVVAATAVAVCIASVMILPVYYSLSLGKFTFTDPDMSFNIQYTVFDYFTKLLPSSYDTVRNEGLPAIYSGIITILLVPLYYLNTKIDFKQKIMNSVLLVILFASFTIKPLDIAWHGFQIPNWLPTRYSFLVSFVLVLMAASALDKLSGVSPKDIGATFFALIAFIFFLDTLGYEHLDTVTAIWLTFASASLLTIFILMMKKKPNAIIYPILIVAVIFAENVINSLETFKDIDDDVLYSKRETYYSRLDPATEVYKDLVKLDNGLYRTETNWHRTTNDALVIGNRGITHSSSTMNSPVITFIEKLGLCSRGHYTRYDGATPISDTILGIKYVMDKDTTVSEIDGGSLLLDYGAKVNHYYDLIYHKDSTFGSDKVTYTIFSNPYYAGIAYMASNDVLSADVSTKNPFENQNELFSSIMGNDTEYFKPLSILETRYTNVTRADAVNQVKYSIAQTGSDSYIEYVVQAETDDDIYLYFPTYYEKKINLWYNSEYDEATGAWKTDSFSTKHTFLNYYYEGEYYVVLKIDAQFVPGQVFVIRATIANEYTYMSDQLFYYLDQDAFAADAALLKQRALNVSSYSDTYIKGTVLADHNQILMTSIPFEGGWTIKVDGERVEPIAVCDCLIGIPVGSGEHTVVMSFFPRGLALGIFLLVLGAGVTLLFYCSDNKKKLVFIKAAAPKPAPSTKAD